MNTLYLVVGQIVVWAICLALACYFMGGRLMQTADDLIWRHRRQLLNLDDSDHRLFMVERIEDFIFKRTWMIYSADLFLSLPLAIFGFLELGLRFAFKRWHIAPGTTQGGVR